MLDPVAEELLRSQACFFVKGKMPDILRTAIPQSSFKKDKLYIIALIEASENNDGYSDDSLGGINLNRLVSLEERYAKDSLNTSTMKVDDEVPF